MAGNHPFVEKFLRATAISGTIFELNATAGAAANNTTIARYVVSGTTTDRIFNPTLVETASSPTQDTPRGKGWREAAAQDASNEVAYIIPAGNIGLELKVRYRRSGQALEVDQQALITVKFFRVSSTGTFKEYLGEASASALTFTTTVQSVTLSYQDFANPHTWTFDANDRVQVEVYVQTTVLTVPTPPTVATDLWCTIGEASADGAKVTCPTNYEIHYRRTISARLLGVDTLARDLTLRRTLSARMLGRATVIRKTGKTLSARMVGVASMSRKIGKILTATMLGVATMVRKTSKILTAVMRGVATVAPRLTLFRTLAVRMAGVAIFTRRLILRRTLAATMLGRAAGYLKLPFDKVPTGGGTTIIRKILNIFDD